MEKNLFLTHVENIEKPEIDFWYVDQDTTLEAVESYYRWFISDREQFTVFEIALDSLQDYEDDGLGIE